MGHRQPVIESVGNWREAGDNYWFDILCFTGDHPQELFDIACNQEQAALADYRLELYGDYTYPHFNAPLRVILFKACQTKISGVARGGANPYCPSAVRQGSHCCRFVACIRMRPKHSSPGAHVIQRDGTGGHTRGRRAWSVRYPHLVSA